MAVDVSKIPNNNKFDPVREAILDLQTSIEDTGAAIGNGTLTINTSSPLTGTGTFTANQTGPTTISIGIDGAEYLTNITHDTVNQKLVVTRGDATTFDINLSQYIDDTNLARLVSGTLDNQTGIATFTRDDATTFDVDLSALFDDTDTNDFLTAASFNTADGVVTFTVQNQTDVTVDLDGRYPLFSDLDDFITLGDLSASTNATPFGSGALLYDQATGDFEYTPPDLSGFVSSTELDDYLPLTGGSLTGLLTAGVGIDVFGDVTLASGNVVLSNDTDRIYFGTTARNGSVYFDTTLDGVIMQQTQGADWTRLRLGDISTGHKFQILDGDSTNSGEFDGTNWASLLTLNADGDLTVSGTFSGDGSGITGLTFNLQNVTDNGNTTTNDISFADGQGIVSASGAEIKTGGGGNTFQAQAGTSNASAFMANNSAGTTQFSADEGGDGYSYFAGKLVVNGTAEPAENFKVNGSALITGTLTLSSTDGDELAFEGGKHWITSNDGAGNFNIRIGHYDNSSGVEECTEDGYIFHDEWSQGSSWRQFNVSADSMTVGQTIGTDSSWRTQIEYDTNSVYLRHQGNLKFQTTSGGVTVTGNITSDSIVKSGGTQSQFLKADGSVTTLTVVTNANTTPISSGALLYNTATGDFDYTPPNLDGVISETAIDTKLDGYLPTTGGTLTGLLTTDDLTVLGDLSVGGSVSSGLSLGNDIDMNDNDVLDVRHIRFTNQEGDIIGNTTGALMFDENFFNDTEYGSTSIWNGNGGGLAIYNEDGWGRIVSDANMEFLNAEFNSLTTGNISTSGAFTSQVTFNEPVGFGTAPNASWDVNINNNLLFETPSEGLAYEPQEGALAAQRYFIKFDHTNNASYPFLTNRTPNGAVVIKTGTAAGGGENEHFRIEGGDGTVDAYFTNANLGIQETTPSALLDIANTVFVGYDGTYGTGYGMIGFGGQTNGSARIFGGISNNKLYLASGTGGDIQFRVNGSSSASASAMSDGDFYFANSVGIGTTSPNAKLEIYGTGNTLRLDSAANQSKTILLRNVGTSTAEIKTDGNLKLWAEDAGRNIYFDTSSGTKMTILSGGNVGINKTSPSDALDVNGNIALNGDLHWANGEITSDDNNTGARIVARATSNPSDGNAIFAVESSGSATRFGVTQGYGGWFRDKLQVGYAYDSGGLSDPTYHLDVAGTIRATGDVIAYSDARVKENVKTIDNALDKVSKLRGVEYNKIGETEQKIGVIAQEIEQILPQVVAEDDNGMKSVAYGNIVGVLIEAIKEQSQIIDDLKQRITKLES